MTIAVTVLSITSRGLVFGCNPDSQFFFTVFSISSLFSLLMTALQQAGLSQVCACSRQIPELPPLQTDYVAVTLAFVRLTLPFKCFTTGSTLDSEGFLALSGGCSCKDGSGAHPVICAIRCCTCSTICNMHCCTCCDSFQLHILDHHPKVDNTEITNAGWLGLKEQLRSRRHSDNCSYSVPCQGHHDLLAAIQITGLFPPVSFFFFFLLYIWHITI